MLQSVHSVSKTRIINPLIPSLIVNSPPERGLRLMPPLRERGKRYYILQPRGDIKDRGQGASADNIEASKTLPNLHRASH